MKKTTKIMTIIVMLAIIAHIMPVFAVRADLKCDVVVNGQRVEWKLQPFLAYCPHGSLRIMIPMKELFTTLGYTVTYDAKTNSSIFTADKNSSYDSFFVDLKTGQVFVEGEKMRENGLNSVYLVNNNLYLTNNGYLGLSTIAESFMNGSIVEVKHEYIHSPDEHFITLYADSFPIKENLSSLTVEISAAKSPDRPFVGEQYTKYNTGEWVSGAKVKSKFREITLEGLWDGFDKLRFYTGKGERNELTGKNSRAYAIAWDLMDAVADEINRIRKQNGLAELKIDNSLSFMSVGAKDLKVDSVFDNAVHNLENRTAAHTYCGRTIKAECWASIFLQGEYNPATKKYDKSTAVIAKNIAEGWYESSKGHREIMMSKKYETMGILVIIGDAGITTSSHAYAVFK
jgi:uncharacterized protein YkwD